MYESKTQPLLPRDQFMLRVLRHCLAALLLLLVSLGLGTLGLMHFEERSWHDAFLDATLMLGGLGPGTLPDTVAGKVFIALFGLYTGLVFIGACGLILAPVAHRLIHRFHLDSDDH